MLVYNVRHDWPKKAGYFLDRPHGRPYYIFAHYYTDVSLTCGNEVFRIPAGGCVLMEPDIAHRMECENDLIHNWIHLGAEILPLLQKYSIPVNTPMYPHRHETLSDMFWKMETEFYSDKSFKEELLESLVNSFLIWLSRAIREQNTQSFSPRTVQKMTVARKTILSSSERKWTLAQMAQLIPFSPSRFHSIYKALFSTTPNKDLIDIRVSLAKSLLQTRPDITMVEAAEILGYNDQYHFIRQFKAVTGQSPGKYRRNK